jgi:hypothetical protein
MDDVTTPEETSQAPEAAEPTITAPQETYVNSDGSFKDGWQTHLVPQDMYKRNKMTLDGMKSVEDLLTHINNQDLTISRQGKGIFPPGEDAKEFEIKAFHKAIGVPDTPDGYTLNIPEEVQKYYQDDELMGEAKVVMHRLGVTPKQFAGIMALDAKRMQQAEQAMEADPESFFWEAFQKAGPVMAEKAEKALREKWGDNYDARMQLANAAITENTPDNEEREELLALVGNNPQVADMLATIYQKHHTESHGIDTSLGYGAQYMNIDQQIQALQRDTDYTDGKKNPARHKKLVEDVQKLYEKKSGGEMVK